MDLLDVLYHDQMSEDDWKDLNELTRELIVKRMQAMVIVPKSLKTQAIKTVLQSYERSPADSCQQIPLRNLTNSIVQEFLMIMRSAKESGEALITSKATEHEVLMSLLTNNQISEVNLNEINNWCASSISLADLKECPNIRSLTLWNRDLPVKAIPVLPHIQLQHWGKLEVLSMRGYLCDDEILKKIRDKFPLLVVLEFSISIPNLSMDSADYLAQMENLQCLFIGTEGFNFVKHEEIKHITEIIAHAAGRSVKLHTLQFGAALNALHFVKMYGKWYPEKKLTIKCLAVSGRDTDYFNRDFLCDGLWPSNLVVDELTFYQGCFKAILNISNKKSLCLKKMSFWGTPNSVVYRLLEEFGPTIKSVEIKYNESDIDMDYMDLSRVIHACPILEELNFHDPIDFLNIQGQGLSPLHFKNFKSFNYLSHRKALRNRGGCEMDNIFKMFLLGSENYKKKLTVSTDQLSVLLEALRENPNCLDKLEELEIFPAFRVTDRCMPELIQDAFLICGYVIFGSPYLKKITLNVYHNMTIARAAIKNKFAQHRRLTKILKIKLQLVLTHQGAAFSKALFNICMDNMQFRNY